MSYVVFGYNNPTGANFLELISNLEYDVRGRTIPTTVGSRFVFCDLTSDSPLIPTPPMKGVLVSFAPIWLLATYLNRILSSQPQALRSLIGIIAISSSSYITKSFAFSQYDQTLARSLHNAHELIFKFCNSLRINCQILAPTLVYGSKHHFKDKNISILIKLLRLSPLIALPSGAGLRQPIHASHLALVAQNQAKKMLNGLWSASDPPILALGGDDILTYTHMLLRIQQNLPSGDAGKRCKIIRIPNRLFLSFAAPLLPVNIKLAESLLRINSSLAGFPKVHNILQTEPLMFPVLPLPL